MPPFYPILFLKSSYFYTLIYLKMIRTGLVQKFRVAFLIAILGVSAPTYGQTDKPPAQQQKSFSDRLLFGGSLGLSFGSQSTLVDVAPIVGYAITNDFMVGIGLTYKFYQYRNYYYNVSDFTFSNLKMNIYGGSLWSRYFLTRTEIPIIENTFLHVEYEPLFIAHDHSYNPTGDFIDPYGRRFSKQKENITLHGIFAGGGIRQPIGGRSFMYLEVLWNLNEDIYSFYSNPRIRIGIAVGF
jgi:hypothetical protein